MTSDRETLSSSRKRALSSSRGKVLQRLFADEYDQRPTDDPLTKELIGWEGEDPMANAYADRLYAEIRFRQAEVDAVIVELARGWSLERLTRVDRNILRIGLCEILFDPEVPFRVSVHEALDLAHKYSDPEVVSFINGILHEAGVRHAPAKGPYDPAPAPPGKPSRSPSQKQARSPSPDPAPTTAPATAPTQASPREGKIPGKPARKGGNP
ncbi:MAG: transcription antitermination factor NusB [Leptospirales bacterium]